MNGVMSSAAWTLIGVFAGVVGTLLIQKIERRGGNQ